MVPPASHGVSRVPRYSGYCWLHCPFTYTAFTFSGPHSHVVLLKLCIPSAVRNPGRISTSGLAFSAFARHYFSSSPYLDVSVQAVPLLFLWIQNRILGYEPKWIAPFRHPRINAYLQLPAAFRSLSRLSSAPGAKAFALRPL